jgi:4-hydroxy-tetrahydrodipicolinate synthase
MVTPFRPPGGVDGKALASLTEALVQAGVHGLYPLGTTGEAFLMTLEERQEAAETVLRQAGGRVPVVVHVGALGTADAVTLARHAVDAGADGIGAVTPSYYAVNEREMIAYYAAIAGAVPPDFPVYLYNIPQCSANRLVPAVVKALAADFPNFVGVKNSTPDLVLFQQYLCVRPGFSALIGCDQLILAALAMGGAGAVSGNVNVVPEPYVNLYDAFKAGDLKRARQLQRRVNAVAAALKNGVSLAHFKAGLDFRGLSGGSVRPPLLDLTAAERDQFYEALEELGVPRAFPEGKEERSWEAG